MRAVHNNQIIEKEWLVAALSTFSLSRNGRLGEECPRPITEIEWLLATLSTFSIFRNGRL